MHRLQTRNVKTTDQERQRAAGKWRIELLVGPRAGEERELWCFLWAHTEGCPGREEASGGLASCRCRLFECEPLLMPACLFPTHCPNFSDFICCTKSEVVLHVHVLTASGAFPGKAMLFIKLQTHGGLRELPEPRGHLWIEVSVGELDCPLLEFWQLFLFNWVFLRLTAAKVMSWGNKN